MALIRLMSVAKSSPTLTASLQAGGLMCLGDVISQTVIEKNGKWDILRTARFGALGCFMVGPVLRTWYGILETRIALKSRGLTAAAKMFVDQGIMAPIFLANFIAINSATQGNSWATIKKDVSTNYRDILVANYQLWPAVQMINFTFVPLQYRVLFVQSVAVSWNTYLSWKTNVGNSPEKLSS